MSFPPYYGSDFCSCALVPIILDSILLPLNKATYEIKDPETNPKCTLFPSKERSSSVWKQSLHGNLKVPGESQLKSNGHCETWKCVNELTVESGGGPATPSVF